MQGYVQGELFLVRNLNRRRLWTKTHRAFRGEGVFGEKFEPPEAPRHKSSELLRGRGPTSFGEDRATKGHKAMINDYYRHVFT